MDYYPFPGTEIVLKWVENGHPAYELIEPVDGFHPGQTFNALMADWFWNKLQEDHPDWIGTPNPNNELITQIFGNQGGYWEQKWGNKDFFESLIDLINLIKAIFI